MTNKTKHWDVKKAVSKGILDKFPEVHPMMVQLLVNRGIDTQEGLDSFLNPDYHNDVHDPFLFKDMQKVVDRIFKALEAEQVIMIHGDYDADGICGTALLVSVLKEICERRGCNAFENKRVRTYLPDREGDGYGMSMSAVERFKGEGVDLIITVDCGIANVDEIKRAYELEMDVIVVDHHQLAETVPERALIIHPLAPGEDYPFKKLAAVGVAYKVGCALYEGARKRGVEIPEGFEKWQLDLVSIATVTDMVPLIGENRVLETYGLVVLNKTVRPGLVALFDVARLKQGKLTTTDVGFRIGPRINAAGRIADAHIALKLLLADNMHSAQRLAKRLDDVNQERQRVSEAAMTRAIAALQSSESLSFAAVVDHETHIGVAGLVAGKMARKLGVPSVVITKVGERYVGSGRAPKGYHFVKAMETCRELMISGGGHPEACGFALAEDKVDDWITAMTKFSEEYSSGDVGERVDVDAIVSLDDIDWKFVELMERMSPFGIGNSTPSFVSRGVQVIAAEPVGKTGKHLRLTVVSEEQTIRQCIGFGFGARSSELVMGDIIDIAFEVGINEWNGSREIQLSLIDIKKP